MFGQFTSETIWSWTFLCWKVLIFFIELQLIYSVVPLSSVQQSDSVIHIYTFFFYIMFHYGLSQDIEHSSLCGRFLITDSISLLVIGLSDILLLYNSILVGWMFLRIYPFLLGYLICWDIIIHGSLLLSFDFMWYQL